MTPYIDAGFLLTLLVRVEGSVISNAILRELEPPIGINSLHLLQVENFLFQNKFSIDEAHRLFEPQAQRTWTQYLSEGVFIEVSLNWENAFALARTWNRRRSHHPALPLLLLHPALAVLAESTHFLSFDPRSRQIARLAGLKLLPARL